MRRHHPAFTLIEIMIVVVLIGLLAAIAIPAFRKIRNNAVEKSLLNDARQISLATLNYAAENNETQIPVRSLGRLCSRLSAGTILIDGSGNGPWGTANGDLTSAAYASMTLETGSGSFGLINPAFDPALSSNSLIASASYANGLRFSVDTGQLKSWSSL